MYGHQFGEFDCGYFSGSIHNRNAVFNELIDELYTAVQKQLRSFLMDKAGVNLLISV